MSILARRARVWTVLAGAVALAGMACALAVDPPASPPAPSKELREKMAVLHEQMAACLRSDKLVSECHAALMKSCRTELGAEGCTAMMGHGMGPGRHMMQPQ